MGNFTNLKAFILKNNPDIFALSETNLHDDIQDSDFQLPGYLPIHRKDAGHMHVLAVYVKRAIFRLLQGLFLRMKMSLIYMFSFCSSTFYYLHTYSSSSCSVVEAVSSNIDKAHTLQPFANIMW